MSDDQRTPQSDEEPNVARTPGADLPWFHAPFVPDAGDVITLDADEAQHAAKSRRKDINAPIAVFDGNGRVAVCRVTMIEKRARSLSATVERVHVSTPPSCAIHIVTALPKGDRQGTMLSMLTQIGVQSITPLLAERSVVTPASSFRQRAARICIEACKQSRNPHLPQIQDATTINAMVGDPNTQRADAILLMAHPDGSALPNVHGADARDVTLCIGPEGGFTDAELQCARHAAQRVRLGGTILRIETAAVVGSALLRSLYDGPGPDAAAPEASA